MNIKVKSDGMNNEWYTDLLPPNILFFLSVSTLCFLHLQSSSFDKVQDYSIQGYLNAQIAPMVFES